jgi:hypothetical protein
MGAGAAYIGCGSDVKSPRTECIEFIAARRARGGVRTGDER